MPFLRIYKLYFSKDKKYIRALSNVLGFVPNKIVLYKLAFRHKSVAPKQKEGVKNSNERLEFLGDAILGAIIAELLFKKYPFKDEGFLTEMRSKIVNRTHLNHLAKKVGLSNFIDYDTRAINNHTKQDSLAGDAFEALIGAIYLDKGYFFTKQFLLKRMISPHVDIDLLEHTEVNYKSKLIEWCQRTGKNISFTLTDDQKNSNRLFTVKVLINNDEYGIGQDFTKKNAEKNAAEKTCMILGI